MADAVTTPQFRRLAGAAAQGLIIKPLVESYLMQGKFPDVFTVTFRDEGKERQPDGFFHPSSHPMMAERQLYYYMRADPADLIPEVIAYENRMAMVMGTGAHSFIQMCMLDAGLLIKPTGTCVCCGREHGFTKNKCPEWGALDTDLNRRGHCDGILRLEPWGTGLFEFKTINPRACFGLSDGNVEWLRTKHLDYYAQLQDYMDMMGLRKAIIIFAILGFPWKLVEIEVEYDLAFVTQMKTKYRRVRDAVERRVPPDPCCAPLSKEAKVCFARQVCPIGRIR